MKKERKPETFGNRCNRCGDYLEDGFCRCYNHNGKGYSLIPDKAFYRKTTSRAIKRICSICNGKPCICSALKGSGILLS